MSIFEEPKVKMKTRGVPRPPLSTITNTQCPTVEPDIQPVFEVSERALKVFSILFYTQSSEAENIGEVAWSDFLHAMSSVGFAVEKLYGSVWQFTPAELDVDRSIQFHEPHPTSKIPSTVAKRHGRRLNRAYGWHGGMFVRG